jgi:hypothetical protein
MRLEFHTSLSARLTIITDVTGGSGAEPKIVMSGNSIVLRAYVETDGDGGTWSIGYKCRGGQYTQRRVLKIHGG